MKNCIILSNIGNRNIQFKGNSFAASQELKELMLEAGIDGSEAKHFRRQTEFALNNITQLKGKLSLAIIDKIIDSIIKEYNVVKLILFATDQRDDKYNEQDTLFEAEIMKELIKEKYGINVTINIYKGDPTHTDELMRYFRLVLLELKKSANRSEIVYCDAGGTPQQKDALKIMLDFIIGEGVSVYYVKQKDNEPIKQTNNEYRNIILLEQVAKLIHFGNYIGAAQLFEDSKKSGWRSAIFKFMANRLDLINIAEIKKLTQEIENRIPDIVKPYLAQNITNKPAEITELLDVVRVARLHELLIAIQLYLSVQDYTKFCIYSNIFIERYCYELVDATSEEFLNQKTAIIKDDSKHKEASGLIRSFLVEQNNLHVFAQYPKIDIDKDGIPLFIMYAMHINNPLNQKLVSSFTNANSIFTNQGGFDSLRNKAAHKGTGVTLSTLQKAVPQYNEIIETWFTVFDLNPKMVYYHEMNKIILAKLESS